MAITIEWAIATSAFFLPIRRASRQNRADSHVSLVRGCGPRRVHQRVGQPRVRRVRAPGALLAGRLVVARADPSTTTPDGRRWGTRSCRVRSRRSGPRRSFRRRQGSSPAGAMASAKGTSLASICSIERIDERVEVIDVGEMQPQHRHVVIPEPADAGARGARGSWPAAASWPARPAPAGHVHRRSTRRSSPVPTSPTSATPPRPA